MKGMPALLNTQASMPKLQGIKVVMVIKISSANRPNIPSYPTISKGSIWYFARSFSS